MASSVPHDEMAAALLHYIVLTCPVQPKLPLPGGTEHAATVADSMVVCDFDDTLVLTSTYLQLNPNCSDDVVPPTCIAEVASRLETWRANGNYIVVLTGRSIELQHEIDLVLHSNGVKFDLLICKKESSQSNAQYKSDAVTSLVVRCGFRNVILVDDVPSYLDAMVSGLRKREMVQDVQAFLARHGTLTPYGMQRGAVVLCAAPLVTEDHVLLERLCQHYGGVAVEVNGTSDGAWDMGVAGKKIVDALMADGHGFVVATCSAHPSKVKDFSKYLPAWATLLILKPHTEQRAAVCWSLLQRIADPREARRRRETFPQDQWKTRVLEDSVLAGECSFFSAEQHANLHSVFKKFELDIERCSTIEKLQTSGHIRSKVVIVPLEHFWPFRDGTLPKDIDRVTKAILKSKPPTNVAENVRICSVIQDMAHVRGFFALDAMERDIQRAFSEIVSRLDEIRISYQLW